jgi:hypothetical protein
MRGLRWPVGPFDVVCVLAAVLLLAAASPAQCGFASHADASTDNGHTGNVGRWSKAGTIAIVSGGLNPTNLKNLQNPTAMSGGRTTSSIRGDANGNDQPVPANAVPTKSRDLAIAM